ncbi:MAG TPA: type II toxin-antitoxin system PemK/MazF family toxin [Candidatus Kapabacteria bacterium]|nr:type II toxin-antitoxin system PemK/MazF family toxin [Candidatus Kapabacteria bacterium]
MAIETYKRGSVVLVRFPYTDLSGSKVRPAVIVTPDRFLAQSEDVLCAFISSVLPDTLLASDIILRSDHPDFEKTGLKRSSVLRAHKLVLLDRDLVYSKLGDLSRELVEELNTALILALGINP